MGWSYGVSQGKEIGYSVPGVCEHPGCQEFIDRGLSYACGDSHGEDPGCNGYFCTQHLGHTQINTELDEDDRNAEFKPLCTRCRMYVAAHAAEEGHHVPQESLHTPAEIQAHRRLAKYVPPAGVKPRPGGDIYHAVIPLGVPNAAGHTIERAAGLRAFGEALSKESKGLPAYTTPPTEEVSLRGLVGYLCDADEHPLGVKIALRLNPETAAMVDAGARLGIGCAWTIEREVAYGPDPDDPYGLAQRPIPGRVKSPRVEFLYVGPLDEVAPPDPSQRPPITGLGIGGGQEPSEPVKAQDTLEIVRRPAAKVTFTFDPTSEACNKEGARYLRRGGPLRTVRRTLTDVECHVDLDSDGRIYGIELLLPESLPLDG